VVLQIVHFHHVPLLSANTILKLGLIEVCCGLNRQTSTEKIISEFRDVFTGLGKLQYEVNFEIDHDVQHMMQNPRGIPVDLRGKLQQHIDELMKDDFIVKVDMFTHPGSVIQ
jgi:hypothetical protein